jgi:hypothetical protein
VENLAAGQVVQLKRAHVCGSDRFMVTHVALDVRLSCTGCGARLILTRQRLASRLRDGKNVPPSRETDPSPDNASSPDL